MMFSPNSAEDSRRLGEEALAKVSAIWHPLFAHVRGTAGFKDLVRDLGFYDYWRNSGHWPDFARAKGDSDFEFIK